MKTKIIVLITLTLFLFSLTPSMGSWEKGEGYIWSMEISKDLKNSNFTGNAYGVRVAGLYMEYSREYGNTYNLSFIGSFYSHTYLNGKLAINDASQIMAWKDSKVIRWVNYEGFLILGLYNTSNNGYVQQFYGIKKLYIHIYTKVPEKASGEIVYQWIPAGSVVQKFDYTLNYDATLTVNYSKPLPYIPINSKKEDVSYYTNAYFNGTVMAEGSGYSKTNNKTEDLNKTINTDFSGNVQMRVRMSSQGNIVNRSGLVELLPIRIGMMDIPILYRTNLTFRNSIVFASMITNRAVLENNFYKSITISKYNFGMKMYNSKSATEKDIENIRAQGPYKSMDMWKDPSYYFITGIPIAVTFSLIIVAIFAYRKNNYRGTT